MPVRTPQPPRSYQWCSTLKRGEYSFNSAKASTSSWSQNNRLRVAPVYFHRAVTIDRLIWEITVAGEAGSLFRPVWYADGGDLYPEGLVFDGDGRMLADTIGTREITPNGRLWLPGTSANYWSTPDSPAVSLTGDVDFRAKVTWPSYAPGGGITQTLLSKNTGDPNRTFRWQIAANGSMQLEWWINGTSAGGNVFRGSTIPTSFAPGQTAYFKTTLAVATGQVLHYTSTDGVTWTLLGTAPTPAGATAFFDGAAPLVIGSDFQGGSGLATGFFHWVEMRNGIDGPIAASWDAQRVLITANQTPNTYTDPQANAWAGTGSGWFWRCGLDVPAGIGWIGGVVQAAPTTQPTFRTVLGATPMVPRADNQGGFNHAATIIDAVTAAPPSTFPSSFGASAIHARMGWRIAA